MRDSIYLTINNGSVREHLKQLGYYICPCCNNAPWIHYFRRKQDNDIILSEFHGTGDECEEECDERGNEKCISCVIKSALVLNKTVHIFNTVEEIHEFITNKYNNK